MKPIREMRRDELAAYVQTHFRAQGIDVVLTGGSCVSIYSDDAYVSMDLDFVDDHDTAWKVLVKAMSEIGFKPEGRHFTNPETDLFVEFPPGPLAVGREPVSAIKELKTSMGVLRLISPTDCVKDRLAAYYYWNDRQCLEQAALVAHNHSIDLGEVERWSREEGMNEEFQRIRARLESRSGMGETPRL